MANFFESLNDSGLLQALGAVVGNSRQKSAMAGLNQSLAGQPQPVQPLGQPGGDTPPIGGFGQSTAPQIPNQPNELMNEVDVKNINKLAQVNPDAANMYLGLFKNRYDARAKAAADKAMAISLQGSRFAAAAMRLPPEQRASYISKEIIKKKDQGFPIDTYLDILNAPTVEQQEAGLFRLQIQGQTQADMSKSISPLTALQIEELDDADLDRLVDEGKLANDTRALDQADIEIGLKERNVADAEKNTSLREKELLQKRDDARVAQQQKVDDLKKQNFSTETGLRKEFTSVTADFAKQNDAYTRIKASAANPSAAGDMALIFNYMKLLDPGSVVRESEFALAAASGALDERVTAAFNKIQSGQKLSAAQRADFVDRSKRLYTEARVNHKRRENEFKRIAKDNGLNPDNVVFDRSVAGDDPEIPDGDQTISNSTTAGSTYTSPSGFKYTVVPAQ